MIQLKDIRKIYFIGIGGIGMSALARYFNERDVQVFGYDRTETDLTRKLAEEGMQIHYEESLDYIPTGVDLVVYTPAVPDTQLELAYFRQGAYPVKKRAEVLGIISRSQKTIAVAGTHGKTTTSSIIAYLLREGGLDCTAFLGGIAQNFQSNYIGGSSEWVVIEADEYDRSFLHLHPDLAVIMSVEADHLDIYGSRENIVETGFKAFAKQLKPEGKCWVQYQWAEEFSGMRGISSFGLGGGALRADNIRVENGYFVFDFEGLGQRFEGLRFALPGAHNIENATAAIAIALSLGVSERDIRRALMSFKGIRRRFEVICRTTDTVYIDDYAHHPTELQAAIGAAKQLFPSKRITGVFQPHLYSRTLDFAPGFAGALDELDEIILLDIYPARELPIPGVSADLIFEKIQNPEKARAGKSDLIEILADREIDILLTLGAGDIDTLVEPIKMHLESRSAEIEASGHKFYKKKLNL